MIREDQAPPLWHALLLVSVPIIIGEACVAVREYLRREHKARLRAKRAEVTP